MYKYKIGDHVIVEEDNIGGRYAGKTGVIDDIWPTPHAYQYRVKFDDDKHLQLWCKVKCLVDKPSEIKRVIFNDPATVIIWKDGTKTVAKAVKGDKYDPEKGFAIAYAKKFGGKTFREEMEKWCAPVVEEKAKNDPLTIEELKKMDGKRVWLSSMYRGEELFDTGDCGWHTVKVDSERLIANDGSWYYFHAINSGFGFRAYLKPQTKKN